MREGRAVAAAAPRHRFCYRHTPPSPLRGRGAMPYWQLVPASHSELAGLVSPSYRGGKLVLVADNLGLRTHLHPASGYDKGAKFIWYQPPA